MAHELSQRFLTELQEGFLSDLRKRICDDKELDLQIRENYLNIYYKGNSLVKLSEQKREKTYKIFIDPKFTEGCRLVFDDLRDASSTREFIQEIPLLKENIRKFASRSLEIEYEQLIIRANNLERKNNSEYFIIDRQYVANDEDKNQFDLTGFYWPQEGRRKGNCVSLCLMEVKFALNQDIKDIHVQLSRYYDSLVMCIKKFTEEAQEVFGQKLSLGLINQNQNRLEALQTLQFSSKIEDVQFILILVDYNPASRLLNLDEIKQLPFAKQIKIFYTGFAMWEKRLNHWPQFEMINERGEE